jgi:hypothetical protein
MKELKDIADILPEGLSEESVNAIFELVDSTITEQVGEQVGLLEAKVTAFLRTRIDQIKDQALTELSEESEVYHNARLFESVRTLMSLELNAEDENSALSEVTSQNEDLQEEYSLMSDQLRSILEENQNLRNSIKVLASKDSLQEGQLKTLENEKAQLLEEVENLKASEDEDFVSSERAVVVSHADEGNVNEERTQSYQNEFLNDEVMRFMP